MGRYDMNISIEQEGGPKPFPPYTDPSHYLSPKRSGNTSKAPMTVAPTDTDSNKKAVLTAQHSNTASTDSRASLDGGEESGKPKHRFNPRAAAFVSPTQPQGGAQSSITPNDMTKSTPKGQSPLRSKVSAISEGSNLKPSAPRQPNVPAPRTPMSPPNYAAFTISKEPTRDLSSIPTLGAPHQETNDGSLGSSHTMSVEDEAVISKQPDRDANTGKGEDIGQEPANLAKTSSYETLAICSKHSDVKSVISFKNDVTQDTSTKASEADKKPAAAPTAQHGAAKSNKAQASHHKKPSQGGQYRHDNKSHESSKRGRSTGPKSQGSSAAKGSWAQKAASSSAVDSGASSTPKQTEDKTRATDKVVTMLHAMSKGIQLEAKPDVKSAGRSSRQDFRKAKKSSEWDIASSTASKNESILKGQLKNARDEIDAEVIQSKRDDIKGDNKASIQPDAASLQPKKKSKSKSRKAISPAKLARSRIATLSGDEIPDVAFTSPKTRPVQPPSGVCGANFPRSIREPAVAATTPEQSTTAQNGPTTANAAAEARETLREGEERKGG
ncbi:hypothetical protein BJ170DRAFT_646363 [Xylariales sp. AK1849]|nr:hypothetical protein BJ170DRAFT_646363 [Xylariales sp. AK1849]